jgi:hypothetical protein
MSMSTRVLLLAAWCLLCSAGQAAGAEGPYHTPLAGEAYHTMLGGEPVEAPARDRRSVTAVDLGFSWIPGGPKGQTLVPFGALFLWRNRDDGTARFRGVVSGLYNELRYHVAPVPLGGVEAVLTFDSLTVPFDRYEYVEGVRITLEALQWHQLRIGLGVGYHRPLAPGHQDNALEAALTYEPGLLLFRKGHDAAPAFRAPVDTYEGRVHLRLRADALTRNIMELPHRGVAAGLDGWYGRRARWETWGGGAVFGPQGGSSHQDWLAVSSYAVAAGGVPWVDDERQRMIASAYGGVGGHLDRFSAFRLGGGPTGGEWEALARPVVPGAAFEEFFTDAYGLLALEYRYELFFFLYLHLRGAVAWVDRPRSEAGVAADRFDALPSATALVTSGVFWRSQLQIAYTRNFGLLRPIDGNPRFGGNSFIVDWSKEF